MKTTTTLLLLLGVCSAFGQRLITGRIMDKQTNQPVPDVNVYFTNDKEGAFTNTKGYFQLNVEASDTLTISHIGYVNSQILAPAQNQFMVPLEKDYRNIKLYLSLFPDNRSLDALEADESTLGDVTSNATPESNADSPFKVEEYGSYPGGDRKLNQDLGNSMLTMKSFLKKRAKPVLIYFEVNAEGMLVNITHDLTDEKAIKKITNAFKKLDSWTPPSQREKASSQYYRALVSAE
jgi:hypothetical protein